jgi:uncharacterized protein YbaR (Trm112 family)
MVKALVDQKLIDMLACPACEDRPKLKLEGNVLYCEKCRREYPIEDDIPVMLVERAKIRGEE